MSGPTDDRLLAFLEGDMPEQERAALLDAVDSDPELARRLRSAAAGHEAAKSLEGRTVDHTAVPTPAGRRVPWWWVPLAAAATLSVAVPASFRLAAEVRQQGVVATGIPAAPDPSFVLVLHGRWPDLDAVSEVDTQRRAEEYWGWTSSLAEQGVLVAAGDLRWEPGERLGPSGAVMQLSAEAVDDSDFVVGMFALRVGSYAEALDLARDCPHLRYGGSVSVRRVGGGFVTVPGMGDWTD